MMHTIYRQVDELNAYMLLMALKKYITHANSVLRMHFQGYCLYYLLPIDQLRVWKQCWHFFVGGAYLVTENYSLFTYLCFWKI